jgi:hypothetical protein
MVVKHEPDAFTVPVTINGKTDDFLLDTGALHSVMTDREARNLGLTVGNEVRLMTGASGDSARFRTAIAKDVTVGATSFHDVSFAVMEPVGPWRDAEVGIVGLPLFLGLGAFRWSRDGSAELGQVKSTGAANETNLVLDRGHLLMKAEVLGEAVLMGGARHGCKHDRPQRELCHKIQERRRRGEEDDPGHHWRWRDANVRCSRIV